MLHFASRVVVRRGMRALGVDGFAALDIAARGEPDDLSRADAPRAG